MADQPGTVGRRSTDRNGDGHADADADDRRRRGVFVDGGVLRGAHVLSDAAGAGPRRRRRRRRVRPYELRWFTLFPTRRCSRDYLNPVGSSKQQPADDHVPLQPRRRRRSPSRRRAAGCSGTVSRSRRKGGASFTSPLGKAVRFVSTGGRAVRRRRRRRVGRVAPRRATVRRQRHVRLGLRPRADRPADDEGRARLGAGQLERPAVAGRSGHVDDDPVWISALRDTTLYVDYDGDPTTGASPRPGLSRCRGTYDRSSPVTAAGLDADLRQRRRRHDRSRHLHLRRHQDRRRVGRGSGHRAERRARLRRRLHHDPVDVDVGRQDRRRSATTPTATGASGPATRSSYDISIADAGSLPFTNLKVTDAIPPGTAYVLGSTTFSTGGTPAAIPDDAAGGHSLPVRRGRPHRARRSPKGRPGRSGTR